MPRKNDLVSLEMTGMTHEGNGVGRLPEGMAVFVPASAPGDLLTVRIVKVHKAYCFGRLEEILTPSPDRIASDCPVSGRCGGCVFRHISYAAELRHKHAFVQENMRRIGGFTIDCEPIVSSPAQEGYRNKAQYPIRLQKDKLAAGFFAPRTHEVVDGRACRLQPEAFAPVLEGMLEYMRANSVTAYNETQGSGLVRHLYLRRGARSGEMMACVVTNGSRLPQEQRLVRALREAAPELASVVLNENTAQTNVILGRKTRVLYGKAAIEDEFCGLRFALSPESFYQVNSPAAERLYELAAEYAGLTGEERLLDLYCGVGTIGLYMARNAREVVGIETIPQAVENAAENAARNGIANARFYCADAGEAAERLAQEGFAADVVVLDPPRKGCDPQTLDTVARMQPERIVYISCNSATLARDCALLCAQGYTLTRCRPVDLFPRTAHVEVIILMTYCVDKAKNEG